MELNDLYEIINDVTVTFRKGEEIVERQVGGVHVTEVFGYPSVDEAPDDFEMIDVHFVTVGVDMTKARARADEFAEVLAEVYPDRERLVGGPSYIEVGGAIGDQGTALSLFALGHALSMWEVITPERLGITGPKADEMAGSGFVMMSGWKVAA